MRPTIIGLDPGTTVGYAAVGMDGEVVAVRSIRNSDLSTVIRETALLGIPVMVATDKKEVPHLVRKFAASTGARLFRPGFDLLVREKQELVAGKEIGDDHGRDALSCAMLAYKSVERVISKTLKHLDRQGKASLAESVLRIVIQYEMPISMAISYIEKPDTEESRLIGSAIERKVFSRDCMLLSARLMEKSSRIEEMKQEISDLKGELENHRLILQRLSTRKHLPDRALAMKEQSIRSLTRKLSATDSILAKQRMSINDLRRFISISGRHILVKVLDNLSNAEVVKAAAALSLGKHDTLYVRDPSVNGARALAYLRERVRIVISDRDSRALEGFIRIPLDEIDVVARVDSFMLITTGSLESAISRRRLLGKVLEDYRKERQSTA
jgi:uncharacterized protein